MKKLVLLFSLILHGTIFAQTQVPIGPQSNTFSSMVRGYHFTAPTSFTICGLYIPTDASTGVQNVAVVRFTAGAPPAFAATTNNFVQLFSQTNFAPNTMITCNIPVNAGDIIGVYGARGTGCDNSYDGVGFATTINGFGTNLYRSGMQACLYSTAMTNIWSEVNYNIGRIFMYYNCCTVPVVTATASQNPICSGTQVALLGGGATTYTWNPGGLTGATVNVTPTTTTSYTVTGTSAGCNGTATVTVNVNPNPTVTASSSPAAICNGSSATLTGAGASTYTWNPGGQTGTSISVSPGSTTTYSVSGTSAAGCVGNGTVQVTVNPTPVILPSSNSPVCSGGTLNLNAGVGVSFSWSGPNGFSSAVQQPTITNVTAANAGIYTVTVTDAAGCVGTGTVSVTVNPAGAIAAANSGPYCVGNTMSLSTIPATSYSWTGPNGFTSSNASPTLSNVQLTDAGTYSVTVITSGGCVSSGTTQVTVNPLPVASANGNSPLCVNQTLNLSASGGNGYSWTGPNGFSSSSSGPVINSITLAGSGTYSVTVTDANGCQTTATVPVVVNALPVVVSNGSTVCENQTINLTASGGTNYAWTGPSSFTSNLQNPTIANAAIGMSGVYAVTVTDANGCVSNGTATVTVNPLPTASAASNTPLCANQNVNLTSGGGSSYSWSGPNGFISNLQNPTIIAAGTTSTGTYSVIVTDVNGCQSNATVLVTVNPLPVATATSNGPVCQNQVLSFTGGGGISYAWTGPAGFSSTAQNPVLGAAALNASGTYSLTVIDGNGCISNATVAVVVNPNPNPVAASNSPVCLSQNLNLTSSGGGASYSWTGPGGFSSTLQNPSISNTNASMAGQYNVTVTSAAGCVGTASVMVNVNPPLNVNAAISLNTICNGSTTVLSASGGGGSGQVNYQWTSNPSGFVGTGTSFTVSPFQSTTYQVSITDNCGTPAATATVAVTVNPLPQLVISADNLSGCQPLTVNFTGTSGPSTVASCAWTFGDGNSSSTCNPSNTFVNSGNYTVNYSVVDVNGCSNSLNAQVNVFPIPQANFDYSPNPITIIDPEVSFSSTTIGSINQYVWTINGIILNGSNPSYIFPDPGTYPVQLLVVSNNGCTDSTVKNITVEEDFSVYIPNAFTPDGDGLNDVFTVKGIGIREFEMFIYDRWGNMIYSTKDINDGWNGRKRNEGDAEAEALMQDTYVYKVRVKNFKGLKKEFHGHVTIVKQLISFYF